jgi:hypothetical protein
VVFLEKRVKKAKNSEKFGKVRVSLYKPSKNSKKPVVFLEKRVKKVKKSSKIGKVRVS